MNAQKSGRTLTVSNASMGQHSGGEVSIGGEHGEAGRQIGADDSRKQEDEPEEAETVQRGNGALRRHPIQRVQPWQAISTEAKQPCDVAQDELDLEQHLR